MDFIILLYINKTNEIMKLYSELHTVDEFIQHYKDAKRNELKAILKRIGNTRDISKKNEKKAIEALLA